MNVKPAISSVIAVILTIVINMAISGAVDGSGKGLIIYQIITGIFIATLVGLGFGSIEDKGGKKSATTFDLKK